MTRGPLPAEAIRKAITTAAGRGIVMERDLFQKSRLGFILFCPGLTVFVAVRRTRNHLTSPEDCAAEYRLDILHLRRVPLTGFVARELWLLSPWGTWQYFRILDDRVIEIRSNGMPMLLGGAGASVPAAGEGVLTGVSTTGTVVPSGDGSEDPHC
jgi:hypothetical protein